MNNRLKNGEQLYTKPENCYGCGACVDVCAKQAISLAEAEYGFRYPSVDPSLCVQCGRCTAVCPFGKAERHTPSVCYAAVSRNAAQREKSTSGGIFAAIAAAFLQEGGVVCGAAMELTDSTADVHHIMIDRAEDLPRLQGSKYVQSKASACYADMKAAFADGKRVLFSGTPCQVAAVLSRFHANRSLLYTMDTVCHGVPSNRFFNEYLAFTAKQNQAQIVDFQFRDKSYGWGHSGSYSLRDSNQTEKKVRFSPEDSSFYTLFLEGEISRDSCYHCEFANLNRVGDLTMGDYWGAQEYSPELMRVNGGPFDSEKGISCILQNTERGRGLLELCGARIEKREIDVENLLHVNHQLRFPSSHTAKRGKVWDAYRADGYQGVDHVYVSWMRRRRLVATIKRRIPKPVKDMLKRVVRR